MDENRKTEAAAGGKRLKAPVEKGGYQGRRTLAPQPAPVEETPVPPVETQQDFLPEPEEVTPVEKPRPSIGDMFNRLQDAALDFSDQVLDWRDDMTERFNVIAADPNNDSLAAKMLRSSDDMIIGIADQQRETDDIMDDEYQRRQDRLQRDGEVINPDGSRPKYVFYTMESAPSKTRKGIPLQQEDPVLLEEEPVTPQEEEVAARRPAQGRTSKSKHHSRPRPIQAAAGEEDPRGVEEENPQAPAEEETEAPVRKKPERRQKAKTVAAAPADRKQQPPRPVQAPGEKQRKRTMSRLKSMQYSLFMVVLALVAVSGILFMFRATSTKVENRNLTQSPEITLASLVDGTWFAQWDRWYDDTFPNRDKLAGLYDLIGGAFGFDTGDAAEESVADDEIVYMEIDNLTQDEEDPDGEDAQEEEADPESAEDEEDALESDLEDGETV